MAGKRYWLKLQEHFFETDEVMYLESIENGERYICIWLKLLLKALRSETEDGCGILRFNSEIPYNPILLSKAIHCEKDSLLVALEMFKQLKMIEVADDGTIYIEAVQKLIGRECESYERVKKFREKQLALQSLQCNDMKQKCNDNIEVEEEIDLEKEKDKRPSSVKILFDFDTGLWEHVSDELTCTWAEVYPACNVERELSKMAEWLMANPTKRKSNYRRFITNWLMRTQDRGGTR
jgi:predicted phage replisome organizer